MKRQKVRKLLIIVSFLLFPITLYYFSPALIINAGLHGILNGSFIVFFLMFLLSIPFGRFFCAYLCPAGGLQECTFAINNMLAKQRWRNYIKYVIWVIWLSIVIFCYFKSGEITAVDFFFETENGISVSSVQSYIIYYGVVFLIFIPSVIGGKRAFCHYFCWMAPFMIMGIKLRRILHLSGLHIKVREKSKCVYCSRCNMVCPMGVDVVSAIKDGEIKNVECIQCGACIDNCPHKVLHFGMVERKEQTNGNGKKT